jgi:hypothetical protein
MYTCIIGKDYSIKSNKVLHLLELFTFHIKQEAIDNSNNLVVMIRFSRA